MASKDFDNTNCGILKKNDKGELGAMAVKVGDRVEPGQVVGNTGDSIAPYTCNRNPHLHLEIRKQGRAIATNPVPYFEANWDDMGLGTWPGPRC